jgi:hypothetical protein
MPNCEASCPTCLKALQPRDTGSASDRDANINANVFKVLGSDGT